MAAERGPTYTISAHAIDVAPSDVQVGAVMTLTASISCSPAFDLRGQPLLIKDHEGALLGTTEVTAFDGEVCRTRTMELKAPLKTGEHRWVAVLPAYAANGVSCEETLMPFAFSVKPHSTKLVVWDVPSTVLEGERFRIKVGTKCSCACRPRGWTIEICDHEEACLATAMPGDEPWPGTAALYFAEIELEAPKAAGFYKWKAVAPATDLELPHENCAALFGVRTVPPAECVVRIEAFDKESHVPVKGAKVVIHPYRTFTNGRGIAEVRLAKGDYTIFVSGKKYIPFRMTAPVTSNMAIKAELSLDVELSDADVWS